MADRSIGIGLYGSNGHQIQDLLRAGVGARAGAQVVGWAAFDAVPDVLSDVRKYESLEAMLADPAIDLVSLCSPRRADQARDAIRCMEAGKHVYAEKPSAMTERDLDAIVEASRRTGRRFHEQAATAFREPYRTLRQIIAAGTIGEVVQVYGQKSYPWHDRRPMDDSIDGGLPLQVGVYCTRFVEHVAAVPIRDITLIKGSTSRACAMQLELGNGGIGVGVANYCCPAPPSWKNWGYETLRVWGTRGFVESIDSGRIATLAVNGQPPQSLDVPTDGSDSSAEHLEMFLQEIRTGSAVIPFTLEQELSPTRWVVRASEKGGRES